MKSLVLIVAALLPGCGFLREAQSPRREAYTYTFCREQTEADRELILNRLLEIGWAYEGPLNNDGLNCSTVLFTREARER